MLNSRVVPRMFNPIVSNLIMSNTCVINPKCLILWSISAWQALSSAWLVLILYLICINSCMHVSMHHSTICLFSLSWSLLQLKAEFTNGVRSLNAFVNSLSHCVVLLVGNSLEKIMIITLIRHSGTWVQFSFTYYGIRHFGIRHSGNNSNSQTNYLLTLADGCNVSAMFMRYPK